MIQFLVLPRKSNPNAGLGKESNRVVTLYITYH